MDPVPNEVNPFTYVGPGTMLYALLVGGLVFVAVRLGTYSAVNWVHVRISARAWN